MSDNLNQPAGLAERLNRPQRLGIFGHRAVGKSTLLTMLYREAVAGRLPLLRLAAANPRTASYLSDRILQLESGQRLTGTLAETELNFHVYRNESRLELVVMDYQGEHLTLGRQEPIHDFFRSCDAVWLCFDAATLADPANRMIRQQEVEQLIEQYLSAEPTTQMDRPVAVVLTKADRLGGDQTNPEAWAAPFKLVRHALETHCPRSDLFAVSSLRDVADDGNDFVLQPAGLAAPLAWLMTAMQEQDEARIERLWSQAPNQLGLLNRCVTTFARRYPDAPATMEFRRRLREALRQRRRRLLLTGAATATSLVAGLWTYDALGHYHLRQFEREHAERSAAVLDRWHQFQTWHPTRNLFRQPPAQAEEQHMEVLTHQAQLQERDQIIADLSKKATDPDADAAELWQRFLAFKSAGFPSSDESDRVEEKLRDVLKSRHDELMVQRAQQAYDALVSAEAMADLQGLVSAADQFLRDYPDSALASEVRRRRSAYLYRLDEQDIQPARDYSAQKPFNFQTRREAYQRYLDRHPGGGLFTDEAETALKAIAEAWDRHDFRAIRDHFASQPGDIPGLVARCQAYLSVHPGGRFTSSVTDLLRWSARVTAPGEYRVVLRRGNFDHAVAYWLSRGPDLSVEIEVAGVRYGPSPIVKNRYDPDWAYEFPRRIRWQLGDRVVIRVTDHDWWNREVMTVTSEEGDPLGMRLLSGEAWSGPHHLVFESDFALPNLPAIE